MIGTWLPYTIDTEIVLNKGKHIQFQNTKEELSTGSNDYVQFVMTGQFAAFGNIQSMLNYSTECKPYCYSSMFEECSRLTKAPKLTATVLAENCYSYMFDSCSGLKEAPKLPATTLANYCYYYMFYGCTSLTEAPKLPATTLAEGCYQGMFISCTNLSKAYKLPATDLTFACY